MSHGPNVKDAESVNKKVSLECDFADLFNKGSSFSPRALTASSL